MNDSKPSAAVWSVYAPMSGQIVALDRVPDAVFSQKMMGDGVAIIPTDGKLYAPVNGTVSYAAATGHAYGFTSEEGVQVLVHVGLDTVKLAGEGFRSFVKQGDAVRVGDLVAEVDLELLTRKGLSSITPVVLCEGMAERVMQGLTGMVRACEDPLLTLSDPTEPEAEVPVRRPTKLEEKHKAIKFSALQRLSKVLVTVVTVMPAAGLMLSMGMIFQILGRNVPTLMTVGILMESICWVILTNLHVLFAVAIGGSWAKERSGGAITALIAFLLINRMTGLLFGITDAMMEDPNAVVYSLLGREMPVQECFTYIFGAPALNMGNFAGILAGFLGGEIYNRFYKFRKLPELVSHFNGKRSVPLVTAVCCVVAALFAGLVWPEIQTGIQGIGAWVANSASTSPVLLPFLYGTLERLLLPFGLHHILNVPLNYTALGGTYLIQTGINTGAEVFGQEPQWLAWISDLIHYKSAGDMTAYELLLDAVTPSRFKAGQMIGSTGLLLGIILAMYHRVDGERKTTYRTIFLSAAVAVFFTGATEPVEFMFLFCAPALYVVYAVLQGLAFAVAGILDIRLYAFGTVEFLTRLPMTLEAGLLGDILNFLLCCIVFFVLGYGVAYAMIGRFRFAIPGRLGNYTQTHQEDTSDQTAQAEHVIELLGGRKNILQVDACMTRLRVTVRDTDRVAEDDAWKAVGAMGLVKKDDGIQIVYGPKADLLKSDINDIL